MAFVKVLKRKKSQVKKPPKDQILFLRIGAKSGSCMLSPNFRESAGVEYDSLDLYYDSRTKEFFVKVGKGLSRPINDKGFLNLPVRVTREINLKNVDGRYSDFCPKMGYGGYAYSFYYKLTLKEDDRWYGEYVGRVNPNR